MTVKQARAEEWARWERALSACRHTHPDGTPGGAHVCLWELRNRIGSIPEDVRAILAKEE